MISFYFNQKHVSCIRDLLWVQMTTGKPSKTSEWAFGAMDLVKNWKYSGLAVKKFYEKGKGARSAARLNFKGAELFTSGHYGRSQRKDKSDICRRKSWWNTCTRTKSKSERFRNVTYLIGEYNFQTRIPDTGNVSFISMPLPQRDIFHVCPPGVSASF